ncbi:MAG: hypothetical protein LUC93_01805 [Planctomycetaceae bacterium]|nr:hypothetical protein [Planctomycetaceae bacterium]
MANHFEFLTRAKPASIYKLLEKLPLEDAAIVLTGLPQATVVQILAYFPDEMQAAMLPAMRAARQLPPERRDTTVSTVKTIIRNAKTNRQTGVIAPGEPAAPSPAADPTPPAEPPVAKETPLPRPSQPARPRLSTPGSNPYESAPSPRTPGGGDTALTGQGREQAAEPSPFANLGSKLKDALKNTIQSINTPPAKAADPTQQAQANIPARTANPVSPAHSATPETPRRTSSIPPKRTRREPPPKPMPWVPRTATTSPINGPALPNTPPPVAGDPLQSPLAQAGLLDLIGRAQEKLLPKSPTRRQSSPPRMTDRPAARRPQPGGLKRPEPREGMARPGEITVGNQPRVIGPRTGPAAPSAPAAGQGARRMDGKAIMAAILREAGPSLRHQVENADPALFRQLRDRMFYFDDLVFSDDNALARVFTAAPADSAALALKFAAPALRNRVLQVVSPGRAKVLIEPPGRAGFDAVEAAQKKVLDVALQLQAAGRILIDPRDPDLSGR